MKKFLGGFSSLPGKVKGRTTRNSTTKQMVSGGMFLIQCLMIGAFRQHLVEKVSEQEEQGIVVRVGVAKKERVNMEVVDDDEKKRDLDEPPTIY